MASIEEKVRKIVADKLELKLEQVTLAASFTDDLRADSLAIIDLIMDMEDAFKVQIPDEEADNIKTVGNAVERLKVLIEKRVVDEAAKILGRPVACDTALEGGLSANKQLADGIGKSFEIEVPEGAAAGIGTVKQLSDYVIANVGPAA